MRMSVIRTDGAFTLKEYRPKYIVFLFSVFGKVEKVPVRMKKAF